jgi:hypothetical protein
MNIEGFVIVVVSIVVLCRFYLWVRELRCTPDPWGPEIESALDSPDAVPLCQDCLTAQQHNGWFCPECGAAVGKYCNWLPGVYIFSIGEVVRSGVNERFRLTVPIAIGYLLVLFQSFACLAPILWIFVLRNIWANTSSREQAETSGPEEL